MNKSKLALNIVEDIYTFNEKYHKLTNKFNTKNITNSEYANALYILLCKTSYLENVILNLKECGYKFVKYEKEMCILEDLIENISSNMENSQLSELSIREQFSLVTYLSKYEKLTKIFEDEFEDLKEQV